jgi:hypothetical protein
VIGKFGGPAQETKAWVDAGVVSLAVPEEVVFVVSSPPTPRIHTPPPCESVAGLAGAPTKALLCVKNAVLAAIIAEDRVPEMEPLKETIVPRFPINELLMLGATTHVSA